MVLHAALIAGSLLFSAPFVWLASTSAKSADELYPPRWLPPTPKPVAESPYIALRDNEYATRPIKVTRADWDRLCGPVRSAISTKAISLRSSLPEFYGPYLNDPILAEAIFARLLRRAPDELFSKVEDLCTAWFAQETGETVVREAFDLAYRRLALSNVAITGWDMTSEQPYKAEDIPWEVLEGDVEIVPRTEGLKRTAQELHYSFERHSRFRVRTVVPFDMAPENIKKIRLSNHADRTWHRISATMEWNGRTYESSDPAYLSKERWQDCTWQVASQEDTDIMVKTWYTMKDQGPSNFQEPGKLRITMTFDATSTPGALFNKYTFNYIEVMRRVPLWRYIRNSVLLVILNIAGQLLGSSVAAFAFSRLRWPGREFCFVLLLATLMIPPQVTLIPVFLIWKELGLYNTLVPLWAPAFFGNAFYIFLLRQFMRSIPTDLEDSAKIDGCGYFGIYTRVILPLIKPALATIAIFTFMFVWNDFMGPLIFIADQELYPLSLGLFALHAMMLLLAQHELMMAAAVLMTIPVVLLFFAAQRQFIQGITLTGLKG